MTSCCWGFGDIIGTYHLWFLNDESLIQLCARFGKHWRSLQKDMVRYSVFIYGNCIFDLDDVTIENFNPRYLEKNKSFRPPVFLRSIYFLRIFRLNE